MDSILDMQNLGYIKFKNEIISILYRPTKYGISLKIRKNSKIRGNFLKNESDFLKDNPNIVKRLIEGKIIKI